MNLPPLPFARWSSKGGEFMIKGERVVLWLALVTGILGFSNSASADWQGTVWGMSFEEANKSFGIPHTNAPHHLLREGDSGMLLFDKYTAGKYSSLQRLPRIQVR